MQLTRLRLRNFRQHEATDLVLGPGLTGIIGPNGAGKTTLLEGIAWAMYGPKATRGVKDSIRRRGAPAGAPVEVELEFNLASRQYRVLRSLTRAALHQDGEPAPIAQGSDAVTQRITRLLGMTRPEFFRTYFTGQRELAVMGAMPLRERARFLSQVLGYDRLRLAEQRVAEQARALATALQALRAAAPDDALLDREAADARRRLKEATAARDAGAERLARAAAEVSRLRPLLEASEQARARSQALDAERQVLEARLEALTRETSALGRDLAEAEAAASRLAGISRELDPLEALRAEVARYETLQAAWSRRQAAVTRRDEIQRGLESLAAAVAALPDEGALAAAAERVRVAGAARQAAVEALEQRREAWQGALHAVEAEVKSLGVQYREFNEQMERLEAAGPDGACPTCTRPLGDEYHGVVGLLRRQLDAVIANGHFYRGRQAQLGVAPAEVGDAERALAAADEAHRGALRDLAATETGLGERRRRAVEAEREARRLAEAEAEAGAEAAAYDVGAHEKARAALRALEPVREEAARLGGLAARAEPLRQSLAEREPARAAAAAALDRIRAESEALGFSGERYAELRTALERADGAFRAAEREGIEAEAELRGAGDRLAAAERRLVEAAARRREIERTRDDQVLHEELRRALDELRADLNLALRPELSALASDFIRDLTRGRYGDLDLDENYIPTLLDEGEARPVISGGEEDVANLALRLAVSQMIAERSGQPLSMLALDEIFGSLDEDRRSAVVELLRALADRFPQVLLITHVDAVREGFDRVIRVDYDPERGVSVVRDEPPGERGLAA